MIRADIALRLAKLFQVSIYVHLSHPYQQMTLREQFRPPECLIEVLNKKEKRTIIFGIQPMQTHILAVLQT